MSCMTSEKGLDLEEAIRLLENAEQYQTISQPPVKPKGSEIFIFMPFTADEQDNYKCDQYRWLNSGPKAIPRKNPLVKKQYFIGMLPGGKTSAFQKHTYTLVGDQRSPYPILLHYIGDETIMVDYPHGNARKSTSAYYATAPSVRKDIAKRSKNALPTAIMNSYKATPDVMTISSTGDKDLNPVLTPRNKSQVRNIRRKQKVINEKQFGIPKEDLTTLHSLGSEMFGFTHYITTHPEFVCIIGLSEMVVEIESLMKITDNMVVFCFHENYKVGNYYITPFGFIHSAFEERPALPCYFLVSDTCDFHIYKKFLDTIQEHIPNLEMLRTAVITNQELAFTSILTIQFPAWVHVYDWEILFAAARAFLRKLDIDKRIIFLRIKQLKALMSSETFEDYRLELERLKKDWPLPFCDYYMQVLREPVETKLGRWLLERFKLFHPVTGLLRGLNHDLQLVIKHLQDLKDTSLDVILPSLYHIQIHLYANIQKSFCGTGPYKLCNSFKFLQREMDELVLPAKVYDPSQIVKIFRVRGITLFADTQSDIGESEDNTSLLQAQRIVEMDNISHSPPLKAFLVKSTTGSLHGVQLFPRESCSCSINQRCSHIMAVMLALGMPLTYDRKGSVKVIKPQTMATTNDENFFSAILADKNKDDETGALLIDETNPEITNQTDIASDVTEIQNMTSSAAIDTSSGNVVFTNLYPHQGNAGIVQMNATDFESLMNGTVCQREDGVLMVVADTQNEHGEKMTVSYEVPQETIVFTQPTEQQTTETPTHEDHTHAHVEEAVATTSLQQATSAVVENHLVVEGTTPSVINTETGNIVIAPDTNTR
eukprot:TCONS_00058133-protein